MTGIDRGLSRRRFQLVTAGHRYLFRRLQDEDGTTLEISDRDDPRAVVAVPLSGLREFKRSFDGMVQRGRVRLSDN